MVADDPPFTWDYDVNGDVVIKTNSIRLVVRPGKKSPCRPTGCSMAYRSDKWYQNKSWGHPNPTAAEVQSYLGFTGRLTTEHRGATSLCIVYSDYSYNEVQALPDYCSSGGGQPPITPIEPPLSCSITDGAIQHGVVNSQKIPGHLASTNIEMSCNRKASAKIASPGYPSTGIELEGNGRINARIKIDGIPLEKGKNITINKGQPVTMNVSSELSTNGSGVSAGDYHSMVVLRAQFD